MRFPSAARPGEIQSGYSRDIASQFPWERYPVTISEILSQNFETLSRLSRQPNNLTAYFTIQMNTTSLPEKLILASSSKYRKKLLERLGVSFLCMSPQIDETQKNTESPEALVKRLAMQKAMVVAG